MDNIENLVLSFLTQLVDGSTPQDITENLSAQQRRAKSKIQLQLVNRTTGSSKTLTYPKKCPSGSARPLAQLLRALDLAHEAIIEDIPTTKRDMFYNDVQLFKSQRTVDTLVDDLAATFDLDRSSLNIRASSKGLICGSGLTIHLISGEAIQATDTEGALIPVGEDIDSFSLDENICWVLIVEKEAVFQTLCRLCITHHVDMPGRGLLITGKGYPDIATRHLVKTLSDYLPSQMPIAALVDADPYGLDILSVYNYGSRALQHENERLAAGGRIEWLGIWASEFSKLGIDKDKLLPISKADEKKALAMLGRSEDILPPKWKKELVHMLFNRRKAEIEILSTVNTPEARCLLDHSQEKDANMDVDMAVAERTARSSIATADMSNPGPGPMSMIMGTDSGVDDDQQLRQGERSRWQSHGGLAMDPGSMTRGRHGMFWYLRKKIWSLVREHQLAQQQQYRHEEDLDDYGQLSLED